jgi:hypothetical protein
MASGTSNNRGEASSEISSNDKWESSFGYAYQTVQGFQLSFVGIGTQQATSETWRYSLNECKAITGVTVKVGAPKH